VHDESNGVERLTFFGYWVFSLQCRSFSELQISCKGHSVVISQNARFSGEASPDSEFEHPPGASISKFLRDTLLKRGWQVSEIENWRDGGWSIKCSRPPSELELVIAKMAVGEEWFLQISPTYVPGLVGRLLKKQVSASPNAIQALAQDAYSILSQGGSSGSSCGVGTDFRNPVIQRLNRLQQKSVANKSRAADRGPVLRFLDIQGSSTAPPAAPPENGSRRLFPGPMSISQSPASFTN
jgi:hypothetical protein